MFNARIARTLLTHLVPLCFMIAVMHANTSHAAPLFGGQELTSTNLAPFTKWTGILDDNRDCVDGGSVGCLPRDLARFAAGLADRPRADQIEAVNTFVNRVKYVNDRRNYGRSDYWASPAEFLRRGGDCEDYAIAKYLTLRALGVPAAEMRIVVLDDLNSGEPHAILVVESGGKRLALDNQLARVTDAEQLTYYRALYSLNEQQWWYHAVVTAQR